MKSIYFLKASWEYLAMVNYKVDPAVLVPYLPPYTELDLYEDMALVSLVGFQFNETKVFGLSWPGHKNFEEINLRFYVKRFDGRRWERGVAFVSEIVPRKLIAFLANSFYNERYSTARTRHQLMLQGDQMSVTYCWKKPRGSWNTIHVVANNCPQEIIKGSAEEFIFEHYNGYNRLNDQVTIQYRIEHPQWKIFPVLHAEVHCDSARLYGPGFATFLQGIPPVSVFLAGGSQVKIHMPQRIGSVL